MKRSPIERTPFKQREAKPAAGPRKRKCAACRELFVPRSMTHKACSPPCAEQLIAVEKARQNRKERQEGLAKLKRRADYIADTQRAFNAFCRERDRLAGHPCISSGLPLDWSGNNVDAGHYRSRGSAPHLRFDERNCHAQSKKENRYGSGNATDYRIGLIARIGLQAVEELEADQAPRDHSIEALKAIKAHYVAALKQLKGRQ